MLMNESAEQIPRLTHTGKLLEVSYRVTTRLDRTGTNGGKRMARRTRRQSEEHILRDDDDGDAGWG